jgi:hypothetical protein
MTPRAAVPVGEVGEPVKHLPIPAWAPREHRVSTWAPREHRGIAVRVHSCTFIPTAVDLLRSARVLNLVCTAGQDTWTVFHSRERKPHLIFYSCTASTERFNLHLKGHCSGASLDTRILNLVQNKYKYICTTCTGGGASKGEFSVCYYCNLINNLI